MDTRRFVRALRTIAFAAVVAFAAACGDSDDDGDGGDSPAPTGPGPENVVAPDAGFRLEVQSVDLSTATPKVTFRATKENGAPIDDLLQEMKNAATTPATFPNTGQLRFTLARLDPDGSYVAYPLSAAGQPDAVRIPRDDAGFAAAVESLGNGTYRFTMPALSPEPTAEQKGRTHTAGVWAARTTVSGGEPHPASSTLNFVPAGGTAELKQVVSNQACNRCHAPTVAAHGGQRLGPQLCLTCHTPQLVDSNAGTSDGVTTAATNNSVDFIVLVHRLHYGADLPGEPYKIASNFGTNGAFTFDKEFINDVRNCTLCHQGEDAGRHLTSVSAGTCKTCHALVNFDTSAAVGTACVADQRDGAACDHPERGGQACTVCHTPDALRTAHTPLSQIAQRYKYEITDVAVKTTASCPAPCDRPTATVRVLDTQTSQPRDLANDATYKTSASSLNVQFGWPSKDYTNDGAQAVATRKAPGQTASVPVVRGGVLQVQSAATGVVAVSGQTGVYEVTSPVAPPSGTASAAAFMDGHPVVAGEEIPVRSEIRYFGVGTNAAQPRRVVVAVEKCDSCHGWVNAHGRNRAENPQVCAVCHNPKASDWLKRQGTTAQGTEESVDFKRLVHGIHSGRMRQNDYVVWGFNPVNAATGGNPGRPITYPSNAEGIPTGFGNCNLCHATDTWRLPLGADVQATTVTDTKNTPTDQADDTGIGAVRAVCSACHDAVDYASTDTALPVCNTLARVNGAACRHSGGTPFGDTTCVGCHQTGGTADIATKHPIQ